MYRRVRVWRRRWRGLGGGEGWGGRWGRIWGRCVPLGWSVSGALDVGRVWVPSYDAMMELERIEMFVGDNS